MGLSEGTNMARPHLYLLRMVVLLVVVGGLGAVLAPRLKFAFMSNPGLNGVILGVLVLGIAYDFRQVLRLFPEVAWIERFRTDQPGLSIQTPPRLLAPMATMLGRREGRITLSPVSMRTLLDGLGARLDESRDISRYLVGLEIFLGLLGTFWGLLETIASVSNVIASLSTQTDVTTLFNDLQAGLKAPLSGMGTAFGTSLFGLAGSLVLGFLDLQASQAQNRFYNELEEWLSGLTRLSSGGPVSDGDQPVPAYIQALLEQTADNLEAFQRTLTRVEEGRASGTATLATLAERLTQFTDQLRAQQALLARFAEAQIELKPALTRLSDVIGHGNSGAGSGFDDTTRDHIRNLDMLMGRLVEESASGRAQLIQDVRSEIRLLARTIAALAEEAK
jgi:hypothetical protein